LPLERSYRRASLSLRSPQDDPNEPSLALRSPQDDP